MDYSVHQNAVVSLDFSSLANVHKSVQRNSRTSKRKIRLDINQNATQALFESGRDFHGFKTQSPVSGEPSVQLQDLPTTPDYRVISTTAARPATANPGKIIVFAILLSNSKI